MEGTGNGAQRKGSGAIFTDLAQGSILDGGLKVNLLAEFWAGYSYAP